MQFGFDWLSDFKEDFSLLLLNHRVWLLVRAVLKAVHNVVC